MNMTTHDSVDARAQSGVMEEISHPRLCRSLRSRRFRPSVLSPE